MFKSNFCSDSSNLAVISKHYPQSGPFCLYGWPLKFSEGERWSVDFHINVFRRTAGVTRFPETGQFPVEDFIWKPLPPHCKSVVAFTLNYVAALTLNNDRGGY